MTAADDEAVAWLREHAAPIRSLDPYDENFADLDAFGEFVADARVVQLGEQTHGDDQCFRAKTRMIKYLHQVHGFDVLVWESGLYDCHRAWEEFRRGQHPVVAASIGLFGTWVRGRSARPMFDYLAARANTDRPLELVGMDCQRSGAASRSSLVPDLRVRVGSAAAELFTALAESHEQPDELFDAGIAELERASGDEPGEFWRQCWISLAAEARGRQIQARDGVEAMSQNRDLQMGANLVWIANEYRKGHRIAVWVDSGHASHDFSSIGLPDTETGATMSAYVTSGTVARRELGTDLVTVHFTAAEGSAGAAEGPPASLGSMPLRRFGDPRPGSLEARCLAAGLGDAFVDIRQRPGGPTWMADRSVLRMGGYAEREGLWPQVYDAVVFHPHMDPSYVDPEVDELLAAS